MPVAQIRRSNCLKVAFMILRKPIPSNVSGGTEERQATVYQPASSNKERNLAESGLYQIVKGLAPNSTFHSANRQGPWGASPRRRESLRPCSALILAEHANHTPLHLHVRGRYDDRRHLRIGGLQPDFPRAFAIKPLQRGFFSADKRDHNVSGIRNLGLLAHHIVAVHDVILDHRIALHLQHERISSAREIVSRSSTASRGRPAAILPMSGSSCTLRSITCSFTGFGNCTISIERLWLYPRRIKPFFSSVVMCLWTVASEVNFRPLPISSKLGA